MAMAVRCGWPAVVEWLHLHCPESALSMSACALNDAARWGHVEVLRVCHKYQLAPPTPALLTAAIAFDRVDVVILLHDLDWVYDRAQAMGDALAQGQLRILKWLYTEEVVTTGRLIQALCSKAATATATVDYLWSLIDPDSAIVRRCVTTNFSAICATTQSDTLSRLLPLVPSDSDIVFDGLLSATRASRADLVQRLFPHWNPGERTYRIRILLNTALDTKDGNLIQWYAQQEGIEPRFLETWWTTATERQWALWHDSAVSLARLVVAEHLCTALQAMNRRRPNGKDFKLERALLASVPNGLKASLVEELIAEGDLQEEAREEKAEATYRLRHVDGLLVVVVVNGAVAKDAHVVTFCRPCPKGLASLYCGVHAARTGNVGVLAFLQKHGLVPEFLMDAVLAVAEAHGQADVLAWLASVASEDAMRSAMGSNLNRTIAFLIDRHDDRIDGLLQRVLLADLRDDETKTSKTTGKYSDWALTLLQRVVERRCDLHDALLATAAESGNVEAVTFLLGPRSGQKGPATIDALGLLLAAARGRDDAILKTLYERTQEPIDVASLRQRGGLKDEVETMLSRLGEWDPHVRAQMEAERADALKLFSAEPMPQATKRRGRPLRHCPRAIRK